MQIVCENKVKEVNGRRTSAVSIVVCAGRVSRCVERKRNRGVRVSGDRIRVSGGIFDKFKKEIWRGRKRVNESSGVEETGARGEDDGRVYSGVQKSSKGKWIQGVAIDRGV